MLFHILGLGYMFIRDARRGYIDGTITYYEEGIAKVGGLGEYPPLNIWFLKIVHAISFGHFYVVYPLVITLISFLFSLFVLRRIDISTAKWWLLIDGIMAILITFRLDILVAIAVFFAFYCIYISRNFWAGVFLMVATWAKVWPVVVFTMLVSNYRDKRTWFHALGGVVAGVVLTLLTLLFDGYEALLSPLTYQTDRGLQIESLWATPFFVLRFFSHAWFTRFAESQSFEIVGPGANVVASIAGIALYLLILFAVIFAVYCFFTKKWNPILSIRFATFLIFGIIAINKVFSPQYLYWIAPMLILLAAVDKSRDWSRLLLSFTIISAITMFIYPIFYDGVLSMRAVMSIVLIIRNIWVLIVFIELIRSLFMKTTKNPR